MTPSIRKAQAERRRKKNAENLITQRNETNRNSSNMIRIQKTVLTEIRFQGIRRHCCQWWRNNTHTHTIYTVLNCISQQFGILFYFILILFVDATKFSSSCSLCCFIFLFSFGNSLQFHIHILLPLFWILRVWRFFLCSFGMLFLFHVIAEIFGIEQKKKKKTTRIYSDQWHYCQILSKSASMAKANKMGWSIDGNLKFGEQEKKKTIHTTFVPRFFFVGSKLHQT